MKSKIEIVGIYETSGAILDHFGSKSQQSELFAQKIYHLETKNTNLDA